MPTPDSSADQARPVRVCYVQAYHAPDYVRGRTLRRALEAAPGIALALAVNTTPGPWRYAQALRALLRVRREHDPQVYVLGFRGHEIAWLVRRLARGRPLVFDAMMSPHAALAEEAKFGAAGLLVAPLLRRVEAAALRGADAVLTDTALHAAYYRETFALPAAKLLAVPVGAEEWKASPAPASAPPANAPMRVLFYGSFLPLHGIDTIVQAASKLADLPLEFLFIGGGRRQVRRLHDACRRAGVSRYAHRTWMPFDRLLREELPRADLCLGGPFGGTPQARRVVTGKTSQCMALGRPTVVGRIDEDFGFADRDNCLLVEQHDATALATAIRWAHAHRDRLADIGLRGRALYAERLSTRVVASRLVPLLQHLAAGASARRA